jgi:hypothetical protein
MAGRTQSNRRLPGGRAIRKPAGTLFSPSMFLLQDWQATGSGNGRPGFKFRLRADSAVGKVEIGSEKPDRDRNAKLKYLRHEEECLIMQCLEMMLTKWGPRNTISRYGVQDL